MTDIPFNYYTLATNEKLLEIGNYIENRNIFDKCENQW